MSGYIYPDLKRDDIEKQLLVKGKTYQTQEVVLPPSIRFPLLSKNFGEKSGENCVPIGKIKYKGVVYSGINELRNILSVLKIDVSDKELEKVDLWELAYWGPAVPLDKGTKDIIPKNKGEINHRIATLLRESDDGIPFLDRKGNFLGKKEFFWGEGVTVEGLQLALQTRPYNELDELDPPLTFFTKMYERKDGCIKSNKLFFKNVLAGSEPKSIFLEFIDPIDEEEDDVLVDPIETILTKSPSIFKEKDEVVWVESKEWSNILKSIITHGLSDERDLKNIEILVPSIMVATRGTSATLPYNTLVSATVLRWNRWDHNFVQKAGYLIFFYGPAWFKATVSQYLGTNCTNLLDDSVQTWFCYVGARNRERFLQEIRKGDNLVCLRPSCLPRV